MDLSWLRLPVVFAFLLPTFASAGDPPAAVEAKPLPAWDARFERQEGWIGGDGVYSVPLNAERTVWLFSDSWVGKVRDGRRTDATIVNNAVAVQEGHGPSAKLRFVVRRGTDGKPAALLAPADRHGWLWPQAGVCVNGRLYLLLSQIERTGDGVFGFRQVGQWLGVVANPLAEPTTWRVEQRKLPCVAFSPKRMVSYGAAVFREGDYLYIYGTDEERSVVLPNKHMVLVRVKADAVEDFSAWRFFRDDRWETDFRQAGHLADKLANEYSVSYLPGIKRHVAVYTELGLSDRIVARTAAAPWGPWSPPLVLYRCPEMKADKRNFCYAAKAHPSEAKDDELIVSYVTNSTDFWQVARDARLYWPRFVQVHWPRER
jgi:hypothetical protein